MHGWLAVAIGFGVLAVTFLVGGMPKWSYDVGVFFGVISLAMFIIYCVGFLLSGILPGGGAIEKKDE